MSVNKKTSERYLCLPVSCKILYIWFALKLQNMINVYITDDHPSIIYGVENMLRNKKEVKVTKSFTSGAALLEGLKQTVPDVLLLDIHLPDITGNKLARIISKNYPQVAMLAFTNMNTDFHIQDMLSHGCLGYLLKTADTDTILRGIKEVYAGNVFFEQPLKAEIKDNMMQADKKRKFILPSLTKREKEILRLICDGNTNQQIADQLYLSLRTIENHRFNLQQKLQVKNRVDLIKLALHEGLAD